MHITNLSSITLFDVTRIAALAGALWRLAIREKVSLPLRTRLFNRFPPDNWEYVGIESHDKIPLRKGRPRLVRWSPSSGDLRQARDDEGRPQYYRYVKPGSPTYITTTDFTGIPQPTLFTEYLPGVSDPVVETTGAWIVVTGHGNKFANFLRCHACPTMWLMLITAAVIMFNGTLDVVRAAGNVAFAWLIWTMWSTLHLRAENAVS